MDSDTKNTSKYENNVEIMPQKCPISSSYAPYVHHFWSKFRFKKHMVIDVGHGGNDPGAFGILLNEGSSQIWMKQTTF